MVNFERQTSVSVSANQFERKFEVCVLYLKTALVFLCMLTVLLIGAISEFKANVFHTVSHGVCAIYLKEWAHMFILIVSYSFSVNLACLFC